MANWAGWVGANSPGTDGRPAGSTALNPTRLPAVPETDFNRHRNRHRYRHRAASTRSGAAPHRALRGGPGADFGPVAANLLAFAVPRSPLRRIPHGRCAVPEALGSGYHAWISFGMQSANVARAAARWIALTPRRTSRRGVRRRRWPASLCGSDLYWGIAADWRLLQAALTWGRTHFGLRAGDRSRIPRWDARCDTAKDCRKSIQMTDIVMSWPMRCWGPLAEATRFNG